MLQPLIIKYPRANVCEIIFNRPKQSNALDQKMIDTLHKTFSELQNSDIRILVLSSSRHTFCSGADLHDMASFSLTESEHENLNTALQLAHLLNQLNNLSLVTIAKVNGATYGGGVGLLCCCDLVVASHLARFSLSELKLGLIPATIMPYVLSTIGERNARRFMLTAETFNHKIALQIGLINEIVTEFELDNTITEHINNILATGPTAQKQCKKILLHHSHLNQKQIEASAKLLADIRKTTEAIEGIDAFLNKREPNWIQH